MNDWIKLPRQLLEDMYSDPEGLHLWLYLLLNADQDGKICTSLRKLSKDTGLSIKIVRKRLQGHTKGTPKGTLWGTQRAHQNTLITICDYDSYMVSENTEGHTKGTPKGTVEGTQRAHLKKEQKETNKESNKEITKEKEERVLSPFNPPKGKNNFDWSILPSDFVPIVEDWLAYKREKAQAYKPIGFKTLCKNLIKLSNGDPATARLIIEQSMRNNYSGIFPLKSNTNGNNKTDNKQQRDIEAASIVERLLAADGLI